MPVSVNISSQQMYSDDLVAIVKSTVSDFDIGAEMLELEITESLLMRDIEATIDALNDLKEFGVDLSVDDFGTGYSSLSYLKRFPIDILKIDRTSASRLLQRESNSKNSWLICETMIVIRSRVSCLASRYPSGNSRRWLLLARILVKNPLCPVNQ
jgi:EAL domain-containing protein (putative c-di-GMP-specific phosphodiesterase class I)